MKQVLAVVAAFALLASMGAAVKGGTVSNSILAGLSDENGEDVRIVQEKELAGGGQRDAFDSEDRSAVFVVEKETGEEYVVHATGLIDEIRDDDEVTFELREGRKGMNAVNVQRTLRDPDDDGDGIDDEVAGATLTWDTGDGDGGTYTLTMVETGNGKDVNIIRDKGRASCCSDSDGDGIGDIVSELSGIEKDQVKRGMVVALVATGTWDDLDMERARAMNKAELIDAIASEASIRKRSAQEHHNHGIDNPERKGRNPQTGKEIKIPAK